MMTFKDDSFLNLKVYQLQRMTRVKISLWLKMIADCQKSLRHPSGQPVDLSQRERGIRLYQLLQLPLLKARPF